MNFIVRPVEHEDLNQLFDLARQFTLLNLPADKRVLAKKIEVSQASFAGELPKSDAEYLFVLEDIENQCVAGSSTILAKAGTPSAPNYSFQVLKKERFSRDLGVGFIHQILRLRANTDGGTEVGGLVVDRSYRRRPEKLGRLISLSRFAYIALNQDRFEPELHAEMAPPLTEEGRSEFWEALGRRFTGMPYDEADAISRENNAFIPSLFPEADIYTCLLDSKARLVLGQVGEQTRPALHLLNKIGFCYNDEVDPFDGGPHLGVATKNVSIIRDSERFKMKRISGSQFDGLALVGLMRGLDFRCTLSPYRMFEGDLALPGKAWSILGLKEGEEVFFSAL